MNRGQTSLRSAVAIVRDQSQVKLRSDGAEVLESAGGGEVWIPSPLRPEVAAFEGRGGGHRRDQHHHDKDKEMQRLQPMAEWVDTHCVIPR